MDAASLIGAVLAAFVGGVLGGVISPYLAHRLESRRRREETIARIQLETWIELQDAAGDFLRLAGEAYFAQVAIRDECGKWPDPFGRDSYHSSLEFKTASQRLIRLTSRIADEELRQLAKETQARLVGVSSSRSLDEATDRLDKCNDAYRRLLDRSGELMRGAT